MSKETINLPRLIALVAEGASVNPAMARRFLHDLFAYVETKLAQGESVEIKGIGQFVRGEDSTNPVLFKTDDELAAIANEPFSAFSAVTLNDGAIEEIEKVGKDKDDSNENISNESPVVENLVVNEVGTTETDSAQLSESESQQPKVIAEQITIFPEDDKSQVQNESGSNDIDVEESDFTTDTEPIVATEMSVDTADNEQPEEKTEGKAPAVEVRRYAEAPGYQRHRHRHDGHYRETHAPQRSSHGLWLVLGILIGMITGMIIGYFAGKVMGGYQLPDDEEYMIVEDTDTISLYPSTEEVKTDSLPIVESVESTVTAPMQEQVEQIKKPAAEPQAVYDTITSSRYLSILARDHYGVKNYWIFIYQANPQLGNPNQISPGTRVLIPAKDSFEEATKAATDAKAQRLLNELAKKYKF